MTTRFRRLLAGAALLMPAFAHTAFADARGYPRTVGSGENIEIEYGPGPRGNIFGGGAFRIVGHDSEGRPELRYLDAAYAQQPPVGLVPVSVGSGEGAEIVWVPGGTNRRLIADGLR